MITPFHKLARVGTNILNRTHACTRGSLACVLARDSKTFQTKIFCAPSGTEDSNGVENKKSFQDFV